MKRGFFSSAMAFLMAGSIAWADGPDDQYVQIYNLIQQADQLSSAGDQAGARRRYQEAQAELKRLQAGHPDWNPAVVEFRLKYVSERAGAGTGLMPKPALPAVRPPAVRAPATAEPGQTPAVSSTSEPAPATPGADPRDQQIEQLMAAIREVQAEKAELQAKLKEALSAQPAPVDAGELARERERALQLEKERDVLRLALEQERSRPTNAVERAPAPDLEKRLEELTALTAEQKSALAEHQQKAEQITQQLQTIQSEKQALDAQVQSLKADLGGVAELRQENEQLKATAAELERAQQAARQAQQLGSDLAALQSAARTNQIALQELQSAHADLKRQHQAASEAKTKAEQNAQALQQENGLLEAKAARADALSKELEVARKQLADAGQTGSASEKPSVLRTQLVEAEAAARTQAAALESLRSAHAAAQKELEALRQAQTHRAMTITGPDAPKAGTPVDAAAAASGDAQQLKAELDEANRTLAVRSRIIAVLKREKEILESRLKTANAAAPAMAAAPVPAPALNAEVEHLKSRVVELETALAAARQSAAGPAVPAVASGGSTEVENLKTRVAELEAALVAARQSAAATASAVGADQQKIEGELARLRNELAESATSKSDLAKQVTALEKELAAKSAALQSGSAKTEELQQIARENEALQTRLKTLTDEAARAKTILSENENLKKDVEQLKEATAAAGRASVLEGELAEARKALKAATESLSALQAAAQNWEKEKAVLEKKTGDLEAKLTAVPARVPANTEEPKRLAQEKEVLQLRLEAMKRDNENLRKQLAGPASSAPAPAVAPATEQRGQESTSALRARLSALEAQKVPFTPAELALLNRPGAPVTKSDEKPSKKSITKLPAGAGALLTEAERAFLSKRYADAEKAYEQVLQLDENNVFTLSNLAAVQLEQGNIQKAEANLRRALAQDPKDAYTLSLLGILNFRQEKFEEALDHLSLAAQLDPTNPETQNYLGITLSQKGFRGPAEAALRRAIQLAPGYASAHHNLAVIYATQNPPFRELARWHYQKSLDAGHPAHPELERMLEEKK